MRANRRFLFAGLGVIAALLAAGPIKTRLERAVRHHRVSRVAGANQMDWNWTYDPVTDQIAVAIAKGESGLFLWTEGRAQKMPTQVEWPQKPELSPGGRWLAYHDLFSGVVRLVDLRTREDRVLFAPDAEKSESIRRILFSPDAQKIAYEATASAGDEQVDSIGVLDIGSGQRSVLVSEPGAQTRGIAWSRDGTSLYFFSWNASVNETCLRKVSSAASAETIVCIPGEPANKTTPHPPQLSAAEDTLLMDSVIRDCPHVISVDLVRRSWHIIEAAGCGLSPVWLAGGADRLAYIGYPGDGTRVPRTLRLGEGTFRDFGFHPGVTYRVKAQRDGKIVALIATPTEPCAVWAIDPASARAEKLLSVNDPEVTKASASIPHPAVVRSTGGLDIPLWIFPPVEKGHGPSPVVLVLGGSHAEISPRYMPEIAFFNAIGATVVGVNFRGSYGYGESLWRYDNDVAGQVDDVRAAISFARELPGVDGRRVFVLAVSADNDLISRLNPDDLSGLSGIISISRGKAPTWLEKPITQPLPPLVWAYARSDDPSDINGPVVKRARELGHQFEVFVFDAETHGLIRARDRARVFLAAEQLLNP